MHKLQQLSEVGLMEIFDIINEASQSSKITGKIVFFISGGVACFNFFKPGYVPTNLLSGMFTLLTFSFIGCLYLL